MVTIKIVPVNELRYRLHSGIYRALSERGLFVSSIPMKKVSSINTFDQIISSCLFAELDVFNRTFCWLR